MPALMANRFRALLLATLLWAGGLGMLSAQRFAWDIVRIDGKEYLTGENLKDYFRFRRYSVDGRDATWDAGAVVMRARTNSNELRVNDILFILTDAVLAHGDDVLISRLDFSKLIEPILRPDFIAEGPIFDTVVIDPGHGGHDSGATANGVREKDLALRLARLVGAQLRAEGLDVDFTREDDRFVTLDGRVQFANRHDSAIFLSLHFNSADRVAARGIETFALSPQGVAHYGRGVRGDDARARAGNARDAENIALATAVHGALQRATQAPDRGIRRARWTVLQGLDIPGILVEGGFVTNPDEADQLGDDAHIQSMARAIARGVLNYRRAIAGRREGRRR